ncbi:DMT family transporter [Deinococcus sp. SL84]|uniref:DMT family transporter n=1 Tax=Deinococcus sp. SL84 TaxID=2994663 RepID=UPI002276A402|nr:DMT family transporter [Deinococcus sp. SL84]MCY1702961.1 DMT family transporter [Deinococcus sp. SL84]
MTRHLLPRTAPEPRLGRWDSWSLAAALVTILFWASAFAGVRASLQEFGPGPLALYRFLVASLALGGYALVARIPPPPARLLLPVTLVSLVGITAYHLLLNYGQVTVPAGTASIIIAVVPVMTALLSLALGQERLSPVGWVGSLVSLGGVLLIVLGRGQSVEFTGGALLVLGSALASALYFVLQKPLLAQVRPLQFTVWSLMTGTVPMLVFAPELLRVWGQAPLSAHLTVVYIGLFPAALAYLTWSYAISRVGAAACTNLMYITPVLATLIAYLWLGERPTRMTLLGGAVALGGVVLVNTLGRRPARATAKQGS